MLLKAGPAVPDSESLEPAATLNRVFGDTPYQDATMPQPTVGGRAVNIVSWFEGHRADYDGWAAAGADGWSAQHVISSFQRIEHYAIGQIASMRCRRSHGH
jgi:choline dehydrogenase